MHLLTKHLSLSLGSGCQEVCCLVNTMHASAWIIILSVSLLGCVSAHPYVSLFTVFIAKLRSTPQGLMTVSVADTAKVTILAMHAAFNNIIKGALSRAIKDSCHLEPTGLY